MKLNRIRLSREMVAELGAFTQILGASKEVPKPTKRFLEEALYGMLKAKSVIVSRICQALPQPISVFCRLQRLCYQLNNRRWDPLSCAREYLEWAAREITANTVISVDMGDISKKYARKMPGLSSVWDGSDKGIKKGYSLAEIEAIRSDGRHIPLYLDLMSSKRAGYKSQNHQLDMAIDFVMAHTGTKGVWVMDRGFDDEKRFKFLDDRKLSWVIRAQGNRFAEKADHCYLKAKAVCAWAAEIVPSVTFRLFGNAKRRAVRCGAMAVALPGRPDAAYSLVVVWAGARRPWYLMTNLPATTSEQIELIVRCYAARWGVEDAARVIKQCFDLENIRLLSFQGLRKMIWLAMWAYAFLCRIGLWPRRHLNVLLSAVPALWDWRELKIIHYRLADFIARALVWPPPKNQGFLEEAIFP